MYNNITSISNDNIHMLLIYIYIYVIFLHLIGLVSKQYLTTHKRNN